MAVMATRALGLDFAGVNLLFGPDELPVVCEVNANAYSIPEMIECCGINVADEIISHIVRVLGRQ